MKLIANHLKKLFIHDFSEILDLILWHLVWRLVLITMLSEQREKSFEYNRFLWIKVFFIWIHFERDFVFWIPELVDFVQFWEKLYNSLISHKNKILNEVIDMINEKFKISCWLFYSDLTPWQGCWYSVTRACEVISPGNIYCCKYIQPREVLNSTLRIYSSLLSLPSKSESSRWVIFNRGAARLFQVHVKIFQSYYH